MEDVKYLIEFFKFVLETFGRSGIVVILFLIYGYFHLKKRNVLIAFGVDNNKRKDKRKADVDVNIETNELQNEAIGSKLNGICSSVGMINKKLTDPNAPPSGWCRYQYARCGGRFDVLNEGNKTINVRLDKHDEGLEKLSGKVDDIHDKTEKILFTLNAWNNNKR